MKSSKLILALWLGATSWALASPLGNPVTKPPAGAIVESSHSRRSRTAHSHSAQAAAASTKPRHLKGERDPFVSPPVMARTRETAVCTGTGRQCLRVGEISLQGVVHAPGGFIAVVINGQHTYFLHDNDPLADGAVERITNNAIILREHSSDALGRPLTREVIRKLGAPAV